MPKVHNIGKQHFAQYLKFPAAWGWKIAVRGYTQEITNPFRTTDNALIIRLPFHRALVLGKWTGYLNEEDALEKAIQGRILKDEDFEEGWTPAAVKVREADFDDWDC